jgi:esterase/lipase
VKAKSGRIIYDGISSKDKRLLWLDESRHVSTLDVERHLIAKAMLDRLETAATS